MPKMCQNINNITTEAYWLHTICNKSKAVHHCIERKEDQKPAVRVKEVIGESTDDDNETLNKETAEDEKVEKD